MRGSPVEGGTGRRDEGWKYWREESVRRPLLLGQRCHAKREGGVDEGPEDVVRSTTPRSFSWCGRAR